MIIGETQYTIKTPRELKEELDKYIIGQDEAKKVLSVAIYNHYKRLTLGLLNNIKIDKSNIILSGPTGCGKTSMIKIIAKMLNVPCYVADATSITQAGYVGDDVESVIVGLLRECNYDVNVAQFGIICLDEVDKLSKRNSNQNITRDVVGEGVQQALLKMLEGGIVGVPPNGGRKHPEQELVYVDTTNILFIGMGAFVGLDDIIRYRLYNNDVDKNRIKIDFSYDTEEDTPDCEDEKTNIYKYAIQEDYKKFGMIPEFIGRFPILTYVNDLDEEALYDILVKPENSIIKQYKTLFLADGVELEFTKGALKEIAYIAKNSGTGARALRGILEDVLLEYMFDTPGTDVKHIKIDKKYVLKRLK